MADDVGELLDLVERTSRDDADDVFEYIDAWGARRQVRRSQLAQDHYARHALAIQYSATEVQARAMPDTFCICTDPPRPSRIVSEPGAAIQVTEFALTPAEREALRGGMAKRDCENGYAGTFDRPLRREVEIPARSRGDLGRVACATAILVGGWIALISTISLLHAVFP